MAMAGLYRRVLPSPPAIDFGSHEGKKLFIEAIQNGTMEGFYRLISYFQTQSEPAYCGLASLSLVLNALAIDPERKWKGPWRWFDESMLDCCEPLEKVKATGISFGKLVCLAHCAGAKVEAFRTNQSTIEEFRKHVMRCSVSDDRHLISSYDRSALKQTGSGHFSPIGGYHAERDMALVLDVARFKYPPHWVPLALLWEAMGYIDRATGQQRGRKRIPIKASGKIKNIQSQVMEIQAQKSFGGILSQIFHIASTNTSVASFNLLMSSTTLESKKNPWRRSNSADLQDDQKVLSVIFSSLPSNFAEFIKWIAEVRRREDGDQSLSPEEKARVAVKEEVLKQVQETGLFKHVAAFLSSASSCFRHVLALSPKDNFPDIAASICCQGAEILAGTSGFSDEYCCRETCINCLKASGDEPITVVSGTVVNGKSEQGVDVLVPSSQKKLSCCCSTSSNYIGMHPASNDVLTALLLALPYETWSGIKSEKLLQEISSLVLTENLPILLQEEVLHLRRQLYLLKRCQENKVDMDLAAPLS